MAVRGQPQCKEMAAKARGSSAAWGSSASSQGVAAGSAQAGAPRHRDRAQEMTTGDVRAKKTPVFNGKKKQTGCCSVCCSGAAGAPHCRTTWMPAARGWVWRAAKPGEHPARVCALNRGSGSASPPLHSAPASSQRWATGSACLGLHPQPLCPRGSLMAAEVLTHKNTHPSPPRCKSAFLSSTFPLWTWGN